MTSAASARLIGELTFLEVSERLRATSILCLPIGSIEQHGPHLPLNTDAVLAEGMTRLIVARWGEALDLWQLPTVSVSLAREHEWAPGTLSLSVTGMTTYVLDLGRTIAKSLPARNLMIVNGHGGNRGILEALALDLRADCGLNVCVFHPAALAHTAADSAAPEIHGGKNETSMMLAIAPHLVRSDKIAALKNPPDDEAIRKTILQRGVTWPWSSGEKGLADTGVIGDPKAASAEYGQQIIDRAVETAGAVLKQLLQRQQLK
jgi:creatinine amidohydrolase/Fe(II)-dependent formamide hydrolase-like protein